MLHALPAVLCAHITGSSTSHRMPCCLLSAPQRNPDNQLYPLFEYFENWCQDETRHGDFLAAALKARPELLHGQVAK